MLSSPQDCGDAGALHIADNVIISSPAQCGRCTAQSISVSSATANAANTKHAHVMKPVQQSCTNDDDMVYCMVILCGADLQGSACHLACLQQC